MKIKIKGKHIARCSYESSHIIRLIFFILVVIPLSSCAPLRTSYPLDPTVEPPINIDTDCKSKAESNKTKYNVELIAREERKEISKEILPFAQMSSSAYPDSIKQIPISGNWKRYGRYENSHGFGADIYINNITHERAIAYRGTTTTFGGFLLDMLTGNIPFFGRYLQYYDARKVFRKVRNSCRECKISVTGHSLGGGLAAHVALKYKNVDVYTFNRSPLVFTKWFEKNQKEGRVDVEESGEGLNLTRGIGRFLGNLKFWNKYNVDHT